MRILGIETSCDETAAAVVSRCSGEQPAILSNIVLSQIDEHAKFGGVVPEIAARAHVAVLDRVIRSALDEAKLDFDDLDGIGVTAGPGLSGGLLVGIMTAKAIAASRNIPCIGVNHLEGHALTARLTDQVDYPYLLLLVSGGHSQILCVNGPGSYERWSSTIDDAVGECFDKTAKLLGLPYPGGPSIEARAVDGDPERFRFPRPLTGAGEMMMSFSGLKTAVRQVAEDCTPLKEKDIADICAGLQAAIADILADRCSKAMEKFRAAVNDIDEPVLVIAGGVAANRKIRKRLETICKGSGWKLVAPPIPLCTDNAAMIAWAALEQFENGADTSEEILPRPRWPLDANAAAVIGSGRKGAKA